MGQMAKKKKKGKIKRTERIEKIQFLIKKYWVIYTIVTFIPTIWFPIGVGMFGHRWNLKSYIDGEEIYTGFGIVMSLVIVLIPLLFNLLNNWYNHLDIHKIEEITAEANFYKNIQDNVECLSDEKLGSLKLALDGKEDLSQDFPQIITRPTNQISHIIDQLKFLLCRLLDKPTSRYSQKDFKISMIYRFPCIAGDDWRWFDNEDAGTGTVQKMVNQESKTAFAYLIKNNKKTLFRNRKEDAEKEGQYTYNATDQEARATQKCIGSIYCYRIKVQRAGKTYVDAIVSITTEKKRFVMSQDEDGEDSEEKIRNVQSNLDVVRETFDRQLQIELCLLYFDELRKRKIG